MMREPYIHCQLKKSKNSSSVGVLLFLRFPLEILQTDDVQVAILHQMTDFTVGDISCEDDLLQH